MTGRKKKSAESKEDLRKVFFTQLCGFEADEIVIYCTGQKMDGGEKEYMSTIGIGPVKLLGVAERIRLHAAAQVVEHDRNKQRKQDADDKPKKRRDKKTSNN